MAYTMVKQIAIVLLAIQLINCQDFICRTGENQAPENGAQPVAYISEGGNPVLPYALSEGTFSGDQKTLLLRAIKEYEERTCLRLPKVSLKDKKRRITFTGNDGCVTVWGSSGISIGVRGCGVYGIAHEIGHAYGWGHEQSRIDAPEALEFLRGGPGDFKDVSGIPYDYFSVMQYPLQSGWKGLVYTKNWAAKDRQFTYLLGHATANSAVRGNNVLSYNDAKRANFQFRCNATCGNLKTTHCENQGYLAPPKRSNDTCKCNCPPGTSGNRCEKGTPKYYADMCGGKYENDATITTPGYEQGKRTGNQFCTYIFKGKPGQHIKLTWEDFNVGHYNQKSGGCSDGFVEIRTTDYWTGSNYCTGMVPDGGSHVTSVGMDLTVIINSQWNTHGRGFKGKVEYIGNSQSIKCSHKEVVEVSPNSSPFVFFVNWINEKEDCVWNFYTSWPNSKIQFHFRPLESLKNKVCDDKNEITVYPNGKDHSVHYNFCNDKPRNITSISRNLTVVVKKKSEGIFLGEAIGRRNFGVLFPENLAQCNSKTRTIGPKANGMFVSPNYYGLIYKNPGSNYPPNVDCTYNFESSDSNSKYITIKFEFKNKFGLKFETFDVDCKGEKFTVTFGGDLKSYDICKMIANNEEIKIPAKAIQVTFKSDSSVEGRGFVGTVSTAYQ